MEVGREVWQLNPILRAPGAGDRRTNSRQIESQDGIEIRARTGIAPQPLEPRIAFHEVDLLGGATGQAQVGQGFIVDREDRRGGTELGAHVGDRGPIRQRQTGKPVARKFDERSDDPERAEHLGHHEHQVGRRRAAWQLAGQADPDDAGHRLVDGLAEKDRLGLDPTDAKSQDTEAVDHRRMRVGSDYRVGKGDRTCLVGSLGDDRRQEFEVHLVHDPGARRDDTQIPERGLRPTQELIALPVPLVFPLHVAGEGG